MDTFVEISCYASNEREAREAISQAFKEITRIEKLLSRFYEESDISKINRAAGGKSVKISAETFGLIRRSVHYGEITGNTFDITAEAGKRTSPDNIILDEADSSVKFFEKDTSIDLGGVAKGYAADRAKRTLLYHGIEKALINIGGNIYALGAPPGKDAWNIGIRDPQNKNRIIYKLRLKDKAVSTSGNYERPSHIINPASGEPVETPISVTVVAGSAEVVDALSTAVFVMGTQKGLDLIKSLEGEGIEVFIFDRDGKLTRHP